VTASYLVLDGSSAQTGASMPLGTPTEIKTLPEGEAVYTVVITIDYDADATPEYAASAGATGAMAIPAFTVSTVQVRGT
jgi:hypothetical protein